MIGAKFFQWFFRFRCDPSPIVNTNELISSTDAKFIRLDRMCCYTVKGYFSISLLHGKQSRKQIKMLAKS